ncbi:bifunctional hydroxymethylpyrimidine kinase/phosphomethylpyrimidine kinase [Virgibacillus xinjiangensis]|uniref:Hydroxymethylpyrimidine/phosphomethylpyrimidine kinase n=1 Tax=Virgibacillus xinjiangensis TaxID=393090 RepID=A0ABV7CYU9_9BACI
MKHIPCALTIAGTDPSGGAGIQADLKTFQELKSYGMSVITSVVAQNTTGVQAVQDIPPDMIASQLESVLSDMPVDAYKTGMISNIPMMEVIEQKMAALRIPYVMDPVMVATSGDALIEREARAFLRKHLVPLTSLITPNIPEAEFLIDKGIDSTQDMKSAAKELVHTYGAGAALIKGGHIEGDATDFLYDGHDMYAFSAERIHTTSTHGTGCTYSAAITASLSQGIPLVESVKIAKKFITAAIQHASGLGEGNGPTNHWALREEGVKQ